MPVDELATQGVEMDGEILFTENWKGSASESYAHATTEDFPNKLCAEGQKPRGELYCEADGARLNDDPLWNANAQLSYENFWNEFSYSARLIAKYKSAPTYDNGSSVDWASFPEYSNDIWDRYNKDLVTFDLSLTVAPLTEDWSL